MMMMLGETPFRALDDRSWDIGRRLADMDHDGVTMQLVSPMPELLSYWFDVPAARLIGDRVNGEIADMVACRPDRFQGLGTVPMQDVAAAVDCLPRLKTDGLCGVEIGSNVNGRYLGEPEFEPFFAAAAELQLAIFVHALHPVHAAVLKSFPPLVPFAGFVTDTGLSAASIIMSGLMERHPSLRIALSHGGGTLLPIVYRLQQGFATSDGFGGTLTVAPRDIAARFFLDSLVYDVSLARYLAMLAPGRICLGTDYPYAIAQTDPRAFIARVAVSDGDPLWHGAARHFIFGEAS